MTKLRIKILVIGIRKTNERRKEEKKKKNKIKKNDSEMMLISNICLIYNNSYLQIESNYMIFADNVNTESMQTAVTKTLKLLIKILLCY